MLAERFSWNSRLRTTDRYSHSRSHILQVKPTASSDPAEYLQSQLLQCRVSFKSFYRTLLRNSLILDMNSKKGSIKDSSANIQTDESITLLKILGSEWAVGDSFQTIAYLELLFVRYKSYDIPYGAVMAALEAVHSMRKNMGWLGAFEVHIKHFNHN